MSAAPAAGGNGGGASREPSHLSYVTGFGICFLERVWLTGSVDVKDADDER